jgi:RecJ-like exonuclease
MDESFTYAIDPHFPGIKDGAGASAFLDKAGIVPRTRFSDLNRADRRKLTSLAMLDMASAGSEPEAIRTAVRRRFVYKPDGAYADHLSRLIDSCGRSGMGGTGVALACGSAHALHEAESISMQFKRRVHEGTLFLKSNGIEERRNLHHFKWGDPAVTGILAEITTLYLGRHGKPVFGSAAVDGRIKISSRTTRALVARGVNLSEVCKRAAGACDGLGGGHNIAAGATIPELALDRFLEGADRVIGEQLAARKA